ncbi:MAG: T9SS type A sorting domain-containing protein [Ignavibacteriaceae bacterium]
MQTKSIFKKIFIITYFFILLITYNSFGEIRGIYRISNYQIFDDGSFTYSVTIKVYNNSSFPSSFNNSWVFYTNDTTSILASGLDWTNEFSSYSGYDSWQPGIYRTGYQRKFSVPINAYDSTIYTLSYRGPSEYWSFGGGEGTFYGDGFGGAETPFGTFYVTLTLPNTANSYSIIQESSPHILISNTPIVLRWIEYNVNGVTDNISFSGSSLTTSKPLITITNLSPKKPTINDEITLTGNIKFPNGNIYVPSNGEIGIEDPVGMQSALIPVASDGSFTYKTIKNNTNPGGFFLLKFFLNYKNNNIDTIITNKFILYLDDNNQSNYNFVNINYEASLYNHTSTLPVSTEAFAYQVSQTTSLSTQELMDASAPVSNSLTDYAGSVWKDYWSSDLNKGIFIGTGVSCTASLFVPAVSPVCAFGVKTVGFGIAKSVLFVELDKIIDQVPDNEWNQMQKSEAKLIVRGTTHLLTFFITPQDGGIKAIADAAKLTAELGSLTIKYVKLVNDQKNPQTNGIDGFTLQLVSSNDDIYNIGLAKKENNSVYFRSYSPVNLMVTDPLGRKTNKYYSEIPGAKYTEADLNGDGDIDDEIFIPNYVLGNYHVEVIPDSNASPTDNVTVTMNASWSDSTITFAQNTMIKDLPSNGYTILSNVDTIKARFWFANDTLNISHNSLAACYLELPSGYDPLLINNSNISLNNIIKPFSLDPNLIDSDSNGIDERRIYFDANALSNLMTQAGGIFKLYYTYDSLNTIVSIDTINFITTDVLNKNKQPIVFSLQQNYPNPFNPTTTINYSVPQNSFVTIKVYDVLGKEITTLVNHETRSGNYSVEFNASKFTSGVYYYRMQAGNFTETKKLIVLK